MSTLWLGCSTKMKRRRLPSSQHELSGFPLFSLGFCFFPLLILCKVYKTKDERHRLAVQAGL